MRGLLSKFLNLKVKSEYGGPQKLCVRKKACQRGTELCWIWFGVRHPYLESFDSPAVV